MSHIVRVSTVLHSITGLPEDDTQWSVYFQKGVGDVTVPEAEALCGYVAASLFDATSGVNDLGGYIADQVSRVEPPTIKCFPAEGGSPLAVETMLALNPSIGAGGLPSEVAVCLSFSADTTDVPEEAPDDGDADAAPERPAARRRGRIFFGPLVPGASVDSPPRRAADLAAGLLDYAERLEAVHEVAGLDEFTWRVYSPTDGLARLIVKAWVDDSFDIQRRRGEQPTSRMSTAIPAP